MSLRQILYASQAKLRDPDKECRDILAGARPLNEANEVTGLLLYVRNGTFLQALEGTAAALEATMRRIRADGRHTNVTVIMDAESPARDFEEWSMGFHATDAGELMGLSGYKQVDGTADADDLLRDGPVVARIMRSLYAANAGHI